VSRPRKTLDVVGVVRFGYRQKPDDLAPVVEGRVSRWSMGGVDMTACVRLRNVRVIDVVCRKGVAPVVFRARVYRDADGPVQARTEARPGERNQPWMLVRGRRFLLSSE
jgi:hypothetical protein